MGHNKNAFVDGLLITSREEIVVNLEPTGFMSETGLWQSVKLHYGFIK